MKCPPSWGVVLLLCQYLPSVTYAEAAFLHRHIEEPDDRLEFEAAQDVFDATKSYSDRAKAAAVEAKTLGHQVKAQIGSKKVEKLAGNAVTNAADLERFPVEAESLRKKAEDSAIRAQEELNKAEALAEQTRQNAYAQAKLAAEKKVTALKEDANGYYQELLDQLAALAKPPPNPKQDAAAAAAKPYFEVQMRTMEIVLSYSLKAQELIAVAKETVVLAHKLAARANWEQAAGNAEMAQRLMIQAHGCMATAQLKEDQAKKIYKLARELNASVPNYANAAQQAAVHVLATFSGLQTESSDSLTSLKRVLAKLEKDLGKQKRIRS